MSIFQSTSADSYFFRTENVLFDVIAYDCGYARPFVSLGQEAGDISTG